MEFPSYEVIQLNQAARSQIGISKVGPDNCYVMVVEGGFPDQNALLMLSKDSARIASTTPDVLILPSATIAPNVTPEKIRFGDVSTIIGTIRFINGRCKMIVRDGDDHRYVDIRDGSVERIHANDSALTISWDVVHRHWSGEVESRLHFEVAEGQ